MKRIIYGHLEIRQKIDANREKLMLLGGLFDLEGLEEEICHLGK